MTLFLLLLGGGACFMPGITHILTLRFGIDQYLTCKGNLFTHSTFKALSQHTFITQLAILNWPALARMSRIAAHAYSMNLSSNVIALPSRFTRLSCGPQARRPVGRTTPSVVVY